MPKSKIKEAQEKLEELIDLAPKSQASMPNSIPNSIPKTESHFSPETYLANDLFSDSSPLPRISKSEADKAIQAISEKRESLRLIGANLQLNADAYKVGSLQEKMIQSRIGYETDGINSQSKMVGFEVATTNLLIAQSKLGQAQEKLIHQDIELEGLKSETPLRKQYWAAKLSLVQTRVNQIEMAKFQLDAKIGAIESEIVE